MGLWDTRPVKLNLSVDEVLTTTRSVRKRLDLERPVDRAVVEECLEIALQAPTGSNQQGWHWVVVEDPAKKAAIGEIYRANFREYRSRPGRRYPDGDSRGEHADAVGVSADHLADNMHRVPLLLIPCHYGRVDGAESWVSASYWGSLLPAVWSFMLALRERGLGSAWTTLHLNDGGEQRVAELLGIPFERFAQAGLFPVAHTVGTGFRPAAREPLSRVLHWDAW